MKETKRHGVGPGRSKDSHFLLFYKQTNIYRGQNVGVTFLNLVQITSKVDSLTVELPKSQGSVRDDDLPLLDVNLAQFG